MNALTEDFATTRKMASVRRILDIKPIPGADAIETCVVDGWNVVAQKAMGYKVGDLVVSAAFF